MFSTLQSSTKTKDMGHLDLVINPLKVELSTRHLVHSPDSFALATRNSFTDISNTVYRSPSTASVIGTSVDDLPLMSRSYPTMHFCRVATVDRHDTDAWTQERKVHDAELHAAVVTTSLGLDGTISDDHFPTDVASSFALMELQTQWPWTMEQFPSTGRLREDTAVRPHDWTSLASPVRPSVIVGSYSLGDHSESRRRVGEILVRCGIIDSLGMLSVKPTTTAYRQNSCARPVDEPLVSSVTADDGLLITALANWTSEWLHTLVIQPYLRGNFRFQYQGQPSRATASIALRIRRILGAVENPVQVAIHALWFIGTLTGNGTHDNAPFLSIPIFRYLHNNGTFVVEDFMLRTFVACAMISDKTVNDATLSTNTWIRLTRIPQVILNATERHVLNCLKWNVVMTQIQWQDTIIYLRSCIKMGSAFDPFAYDGASASAIMARCLDELIELSYADEAYTSQRRVAAEVIHSLQPVRHFTHWEVFDTAEWCPKDDPIVNQKPRTIGIAPGADQNSSTFKVGMTAKDILDSILGSSNVPDLARLAQPAGTSFCGSFGVIGARLAHTIKISGACQSVSWVPSHG